MVCILHLSYTSLHSAHHLNALFHLFILRNRPKYDMLFLELLLSNFPFLLALKDGKSGHTLINTEQWREMGSMLGWSHKLNCITGFKDLFQCSLVCDINPVSTHSPSLLGYGSKYDHCSRFFKANEKVKFQSKGSESNRMYLGWFWRINEVEKCVQVISTFRASLFFCPFTVECFS